MGSLTLPPSGLVYADAQIFIYSIELHPTYSPLLRPLWQASQAKTIQVITSELTLMETLVLPLRNDDVALQKDYERILLTNSPTQITSISREILLRAAALRATTTSLRTPDAIHAATALVCGCSLFLTNDIRLKNINGLSVTILNDVLQSP